MSNHDISKGTVRFAEDTILSATKRTVSFPSTNDGVSVSMFSSSSSLLPTSITTDSDNGSQDKKKDKSTPVTQTISLSSSTGIPSVSSTYSQIHERRNQWYHQQQQQELAKTIRASTLSSSSSSYDPTVKVSSFRKLSSILSHFPSLFTNHSILCSNHCLTVLDRLPLPYYVNTYRIDFSYNQLTSLHGLQYFNISTSSSTASASASSTTTTTTATPVPTTDVPFPPSTSSSSSSSSPSITNGIVSLDLSFNQLSLWSELLYLASFYSLQHLNLTGNPLCSYAYYRIRVLYLCKNVLGLSSLVSLDGQTVTEDEWKMVPVIMQNYHHITQILLQNECTILQYAMIVRLWNVHKELYHYFYTVPNANTTTTAATFSTKKVGLQPRLSKPITVSSFSSNGSAILLPPFPSKRLLNYHIIFQSWSLYETMMMTTESTATTSSLLPSSSTTSPSSSSMKERLLNELEQKALLYTEDNPTVPELQTTVSCDNDSATNETKNKNEKEMYSHRIVNEANRYRQQSSSRTEQFIEELSYAQKLPASLSTNRKKRTSLRKCVRSLSPSATDGYDGKKQTSVTFRTGMTKRTPSLPPSYRVPVSSSSSSYTLSSVYQPLLRGPQFSTVPDISSLPFDLQNHLYKWNYAFGTLASVQNTVISELQVLLLSIQDELYRILERIWHTNSSYQKLYQLEEQVSYQMYQFRQDQQNIINDLTKKLHTKQISYSPPPPPGSVPKRSIRNEHSSPPLHSYTLTTESSVTGTTRSSITSSKDTITSSSSSSSSSSADNNYADNLVPANRKTSTVTKLPTVSRTRITRTLPSTEGSQAAVRRLRQKKWSERENQTVPSKDSTTVNVPKKNEVFVRNENEIARNLSKQVVDELFTNVTKSMQSTLASSTTVPLLPLTGTLNGTRPNTLPTSTHKGLTEEAKSITSSTVKEMLRKSETLLQRFTPSWSSSALRTDTAGLVTNTTVDREKGVPPVMEPTDKRAVSIEEKITADYSRLDQQRNSSNGSPTGGTTVSSTVGSDDSDTVTTENDSVLNMATNRVIARILLNNSSSNSSSTSNYGGHSSNNHTMTTTNNVSNISMNITHPNTTNTNNIVTTPSRSIASSTNVLPPSYPSSSAAVGGIPSSNTLLPVIPPTPPPSTGPSPSAFTRKQFIRRNSNQPNVPTETGKETVHSSVPVPTVATLSSSSLIPHPPSVGTGSLPTVPSSSSSSSTSTITPTILPHPPSVSRKIIEPLPRSIPTVVSTNSVSHTTENPTVSSSSSSTNLTPLQTLQTLSSYDLASLVLSLTNRLQEFQAINLQNAQIAADQLTQMTIMNQRLEDQYHNSIQENIRLHQRIQDLEQQQWEEDRQGNKDTTTYTTITNVSDEKGKDNPLYRYRKQSRLDTLYRQFTHKRNQQLTNKYYEQWKQAFLTEEKGYELAYRIQCQRLRSIFRTWSNAVKYRLQADRSFEERIIPQIIHQSLISPLPSVSLRNQDHGKEPDATETVPFVVSSSSSSRDTTTILPSSSSSTDSIQDVSIVPMIDEE